MLTPEQLRDITNAWWMEIGRGMLVQMLTLITMTCLGCLFHTPLGVCGGIEYVRGVVSPNPKAVSPT